MKKFLTILSLISALFIFVSCVSDEDEEDSVAGDTGTPSDTAAESGANGDTDTDNATDNGSGTPSDQSDSTDTAASDPNQPCTPQCDGKECGDNGCGGQCGMCGEGKRCNISTFVCECLPNCDENTCGDDGCGGTCKCQNAGDVCNETTKICECIPNCDGKQCGDNGCGETCGECTGALVCDAGECVVSKCETSTCEGKKCGTNDCGEPCGAGDCGSNQRCSIDQTQCLSCDCGDRVCGSNGCGGTCGTCPDGQRCTLEGKCEVCTCEGKKCGDDGCGHSCGECGYGQSCNADQTGCSECTNLTLAKLQQTAFSDPKNSFFDYTASYTPNGGNSQNRFSLKIYKPIYDYVILERLPFSSCTLDKPTNDSGVCMFIKEYTGDIISKLYFAQSGKFTMVPFPISSTGSFYATVQNNPILVEVDKTTGIPVAGGQCYKIVNDPIQGQ